jgi:hypothetical protein
MKLDNQHNVILRLMIAQKAMDRHVRARVRIGFL